MAAVEIVIPCYNAEKYIMQALISIKEQTFQDFEVLIVDDGSTDASVEFIREFLEEDARFRLIHNDGNHGECYTRNRAVNECKAEYIAFLDADDMMPKHRLEIEMEYLMQHPECDVVSGGYQLMTEDGKLGKTVWFGEMSNEQINAAMLFRNVIAIGSSVIKKKFVVQNKLMFDENFLSLGDYNFWVECILAGANMHVLNEVMQEYRVVSTGLSRLHSAPDKIVQRNKNFDIIHDKMLNFYQLNLSENEKKIFFEYTNEEHKDLWSRVKILPGFIHMLHEIRKQNNGKSKYLEQECVRLRRQYYKL